MTQEVTGEAVEREARMCDPRATAMLLSYVDSYMAGLGPYVSSVFFVLLLRSATGGKKGGFMRSGGLSINEIADAAGISKRKVIDALKVLRGLWMIVQRNGKGRGNKNHYYFLPVERWSRPGDGCRREGPCAMEAQASGTDILKG